MSYTFNVVAKVDTPVGGYWSSLQQPAIGTNYIWQGLDSDSTSPDMRNWFCVIRNKSTLAILAHYDAGADWAVSHTGCCQGDYFFAIDRTNGILRALDYSGGNINLKDSYTPTDPPSVVACNANRIYVAHDTISVYTFNGTTITKLGESATTVTPAYYWIDSMYVDSNDYIYCYLIRGAGNVAIMSVFHWNGSSFDSIATVTMGVCSAGYNAIWSNGTYVYAPDTSGLEAYLLSGGSLTHAGTIHPQPGEWDVTGFVGYYNTYIFYTCYWAWGTSPMYVYAYTFNGSVFTQIGLATVDSELLYFGASVEKPYVYISVLDPSVYPSIVKLQLVGDDPPVISTSKAYVEVVDVSS